jgi:hypothetical protein
MTFRKSCHGPLLLRTQVFKIRKHFVFLALFYPKVIAPWSLLLDPGLWFLGDLSKEIAALSGTVQNDTPEEVLLHFAASTHFQDSTSQEKLLTLLFL